MYYKKKSDEYLAELLQEKEVQTQLKCELEVHIYMYIQPNVVYIILYIILGVSIHWTGLLDWNTGLDYWTGIFLVFGHSHLII